MQMRFLSGLAAAFLLSLVAPAALAQQMPKPSPELSQIAYFEGTWTCDGKMIETPMNPAGKMTSTVEVRQDLGGFWQTGTVKASSPKMPPFEGRFYVNYDAGPKQFVMFWADSMGGWSRSTSPGWKGDTLTYEGESHMEGHSMKSRDVFTRNGPSAMKHVSEMQMDGKWVMTLEESCKKK